jgi:AraC family transcriptional regulator
MTSIICQLEPKLINALFDKSPELIDQHLVSSLDIRSATIQSILLRLAEETKHPGFASEMLVEMLAGQMAIELVRYRNRIDEHSVKGGLAPWQLRLIDERLREIGKAVTLTELATLCRLSVRQLTRGFSASRGCSIGVYVANSQMEHAKRLLATDESVTAIANSLGFSSSSNFCFAFRRAMGLTPRQFRQRLLRPE